jgi:hypothetical protein
MRCSTCGETIGDPDMGVRGFHCPNRDEKWHNQLYRDAFRELRQIEYQFHWRDDPQLSARHAAIDALLLEARGANLA